jgi:hypothetical protein cdiviTM7_00910
MNKATYDELALERIAKEKFGFPIDVQSIILWHADVSRTAKASVFLTNKKQLMMYLEATSPLILSDVKKIISRMGMRAELFLPPKGQSRYFEDIGTRKFREVFPGRKHVTDEDLHFYKTLAPYNPALVLISEVKNGEIYQFDSDAYGNWRVGARFSYRRIRAI